MCVTSVASPSGARVTTPSDGPSACGQTRPSSVARQPNVQPIVTVTGPSVTTVAPAVTVGVTVTVVEVTVTVVAVMTVVTVVTVVTPLNRHGTQRYY